MIWFRNTGWFARLALLAAVAGPAPAVWGQDRDPSPPYRVPVTGDNATVHAGPGSTHYATEHLSPGDKVDVYRHDPGGWMAIRPPAGSFSLLQRDELEILPDGLARVKYDDTVAWVGTNLSAVENPMWQIRLDKGELVEVLGMVDREHYELESDEPDWVQIMPPAGEFRWIAASDLNLDQSSPLKAPPRQSEIAAASPVPVSADLQTDAGKQVSHDWPQTPITAQREPGPPVSTPGTGRQQGVQGWQPAQQTISNFVSQRSEFTADHHSAGATLSGWNDRSADEFADTYQRSEIFDYGPVASGTPAQPVLAGTPDQQLNALDLQLTREMLKPPPQWELQTLARQAQQIRQTAPDINRQVTADRLLEKIRNCREIQAGYLAANTGPGANRYASLGGVTGGFNGSLAGPAGTGGGSEMLYNYDATGWLNELVRDGGLGSPTYVLQDDRGRITCQVTPSPGFNLRRYLNQRVGIMGSRGFNNQLNLNHITAERVVALDQRSR